MHVFYDVHVFVAYCSNHVAGAQAYPGAAPDCTRVFALHALRTRYAIIMITCHDQQLVEIAIGGLRGDSPAVREGL